MKRRNDSLANQNFVSVFDENHPSEVQFTEQQESERLQRRELFIKLAEAASNFKSPAKTDEKTTAQNNQELQIAIAESLSGQTDSERKFNEIAEIFESNSIPNFAKHFLSFNIIHPNPKEEFIDKTPAAETPYTKDELITKPKGIDPMSFGMPGMSPDQKRDKFQGIKSPTLNYLLKNGTKERIGSKDIPSYQLLVYNDLLKCELGSGGRLMEKFVRDVRYGEDLMRGIMSGDLNIDKDVSADDRAFLESLVTELESLYSQINRSEDDDGRKMKGLEARIANIVEKIKPTGRYDLSDRLVRIFFYFNGIKSADELLRIIDDKRKSADRKNREAKDHLCLNENDLIKLIKPKNLPTVLENGILAKEYLGVGAKSDYTPMDTDFFGYIPDDRGNLRENIFSSVGIIAGPFAEAFNRNNTSAYLGVNENGFCMLVVRNDSRFKETKKDEYSLDDDKYELFFQGVYLKEDVDFCEYYDYEDFDMVKKAWFESWSDGKRDFGVRTGLPSSEIDAIIVSDKDKGRDIIETICNNPFYIPVYDIDGNMVLSPKEYDKRKDVKNNMVGTK